MTLVELVVVLALIAIGACLVVPNIGGWLSHYSLRTATRNIVSTLRTAQAKAVVNNAEYRVHFEMTPCCFVLQHRTTAGIWVDEGTVQSVPPGIQFQEINLPSHNAEFNPNCTSSSGNILLRNRKQKEKKIVLFSTTGRIRVEPPL